MVSRTRLRLTDTIFLICHLNVYMKKKVFLSNFENKNQANRKQKSVLMPRLH